MDNRVTHSRAKISLIDTATSLRFAILSTQSTYTYLQYLEYLNLVAQWTQSWAKIPLNNFAASLIFVILTTVVKKVRGWRLHVKLKNVVL